MAELALGDVVLNAQGEPERLSAVVACPRCNADVECWEDLDEEFDDGTYDESCWSGIATGEHCGLLIVDSWDRTEVYRLEAQ
jgi:hypothetical protein